MQCTPEILETIKNAVESISYGTVIITLNEKGRYVEITTEKKIRMFKEESSGPFHRG